MKLTVFLVFPKRLHNENLKEVNRAAILSRCKLKFASHLHMLQEDYILKVSYQYEKSPKTKRFDS